jgi:hypothetical protein
MLDPRTGFRDDQPVLSVALPRKTCEQINWEMVDPSDSMKNFVHRMKFKRSVGFDIIDPIRMNELSGAGA